MQLIEGITTRRSCRAFKNTPVPKETIKQILEVAGRSPSYTNTQPWEVAVVSGSKRDELSRTLYQMAEADVPVNPDMPRPVDWPLELDKRSKEHGARRFKALGIERENEQQRKEMQLQNLKFYGAPSALFLFIDRSLTSWSVFDAGLFAQSITLAAHSFGLGTCLQAQLAAYPDTVREILGIPNNKLLVIGIAIGYPDLQAPINTYQSTRISLDEFAKWYE